MDAQMRHQAARLLRRAAAMTTLSPAACNVTSLDVLNATVADDGVAVLAGVPYGADARQQLDVYRLPRRRDAPVVVFVHGGAWRTGSRAEYRFMGVALARMGFVGVIADYRHFPQAGFSAFVEDAAAAVAYARAHAAAWGGDAGRVVLFGHSAGAHIAALVALDPRYLAAVGLSRRDIAGWVGLAGPYDFLPMRDPEVRAVFGTAAESADSQPISFADGQAAPARLLHGADDRVVYPANTLSLAARIRAQGGQVQAVIYPGTGHIDILLAFTPLFARRDGIAADVAAFIQALP